MRLIDADALMPNAEYKGRYDVVTAYDIANAPTIEPERKRGKWIWDNKTVFERCRCSECGYFRQLKIPEPDCFCPNCGSDMRGEQE